LFKAPQAGRVNWHVIVISREPPSPNAAGNRPDAGTYLSNIHPVVAEFIRHTDPTTITPVKIYCFDRVTIPVAGSRLFVVAACRFPPVI